MFLRLTYGISYLFIIGMFDGKSYKKILAQLYSYKRLGIRPALPPVKALLRVLGDPHKKCCFIHVAGSNGKGSTVAVIAAILKEAGFNTGAFYSPHISDYRERIQVNGRKIRKKELLQTLQHMGEKWESAQKSDGRLPEKITFFEWTAALAFCYFAHKKVDVAVIETGMGGRFDATNVIKPLVSVITNISLEHTAFLGKTRSAIAGEKAGIIKTGVPVILGDRGKRVTEVIRTVANRKRSKIFCIGKDFDIAQNGIFRSDLIAKSLRIRPAMAGRYQFTNSALAAQALLCAKGLNIEPGHIIKGVSKAFLPGRFEVSKQNGQEVISDSAHNPSAFRELARTLQQERTRAKFNVVIGILRGKDFHKMLKIIAPLTSQLICIAPDDTRSIPADTLVATAREEGIRASSSNNKRDIANFLADGKTVLVTGSFTTIAWFKELNF